jgi:ADP-ribose pyrophosphatase
MNVKETHQKPAQVNLTHTVYNGKHFSFVTENITLPNGVETEMAMVRHPGSTGIVPLFDDETIAMTLQYRHPVGDYLLEIPAGTLDPGESPLDCARRELEEETGLVASKWVALAQTHILPAYSDEIIHVFLARDLTLSKQKLDPDEIIQVVKYRLEDAVQMISEGLITDALSILSIYQACFYIRGEIDSVRFGP